VERPTCKTCPYFHPDERGRKAALSDGQCRRRIPAFAACDSQYKDMTEICWDEWAGTWPGVDEYDWCGEHADFPAWLRHRQMQNP
jgi:hypothetical protein